MRLSFGFIQILSKRSYVDISKMNIAFICGSLEPGKDGVGDYTRRLAGELLRNGHNATIIAINDRYITQCWNGEQKDVEVNVRVLRLPSQHNWSSRLNKIEK